MYIKFFAYGSLAWDYTNPLTKLLINRASYCAPAFLTRHGYYDCFHMYDSLNGYPIVCITNDSNEPRVLRLSPQSEDNDFTGFGIFGVMYLLPVKVWFSIAPLLIEYENMTQTNLYISDFNSAIVLNVRPSIVETFSPLYQHMSDSPLMTCADIETYCSRNGLSNPTIDGCLRFNNIKHFLNMSESTEHPSWDDETNEGVFQSQCIVNNFFTFIVPPTFNKLNLFNKLPKLPHLYNILSWKENHNA